MEGWHVHLAILATLLTSVVLAEDFKTIAGKEYHDVTITRVEGDGIVLKSKTGISKVYFSELPKDVQEKFHYAQTTSIEAKREPVQEPTQEPRRQTNKGGSVVVVGQGALSLKVIVAGIIVLVGLVALIRSRFS